MQPSALKLVVLTSLALLGFAANSLLCRAALADGGRLIDPASFTTVRLLSGAIVLVLLARARRAPRHRGSWPSALALFAYAAAFSLAYVRISAGIGALLLFGCVQLTMVGSGLFRGERPTPLEWLGLVLALGGLVTLTAPGVSSPDPLGAALMATAGIAWGVYSLRGRHSGDPLAVTGANFVRAVPLSLALSLLAAALWAGPHATPLGVGLAIASGAIASGLGYSLWYAALPSLSSTRAALLQLAAPVLAAAGGVLLLGEQASLRSVGAGLAILCGILISVLARPRAAPGTATAPAR